MGEDVKGLIQPKIIYFCLHFVLDKVWNSVYIDV
jgi:hypothetical protein